MINRFFPFFLERRNKQRLSWDRSIRLERVIYLLCVYIQCMFVYILQLQLWFHKIEEGRQVSISYLGEQFQTICYMFPGSWVILALTIFRVTAFCLCATCLSSIHCKHVSAHKSVSCIQCCLRQALGLHLVENNNGFVVHQVKTTVQCHMNTDYLKTIQGLNLLKKD